jgi:hypothetical protein
MLKSCVALMLVTGCSLEEPNTDSTEQAVTGTVTRIKVNGRAATTFLVDGDFNGFLGPSKDQIENTSALDFSYASLDPSNPDLAILIQGAGQIPNSAFTVTSTTAHLAVTTPFVVTRCVINLVTGDFTCAPTGPSTFDLTWTKDGFGTTLEKIKFLDTLGPVTTKFEGTSSRVTASVSGTWDGHASTNAQGNLSDTQNTTIIREITLLANP